MNKWQEFLKAKGITEEQLKEKGAEELAGLHNEFLEDREKALEEQIEAKASKEDIESLKNEILEARTEQLKHLNETLKEFGIKIKKLSAKEIKDAGASFKSIKDQVADQSDKLEALKDSNSYKGERIVLKAMTITGNISGGNVPVEQRIAGLNTIASRRIRLMDIVARGTANSNVISWVYQANKTGAAGGTNEGALKNEIGFDLVVDGEDVRKRTAYIKASEEMLNDIDFMQTEINNELLRELLKDVENQVYQGDGVGTGLNGNLNGIRTVATAFSAGSFAGTVDNANVVDVLRVAKTQIMLADQEMPNYILMNPADVTALMLIKVTTTDKRYIDALQVVAGTLTLDGIPIIETTLVAQDEYLIGNFDMSTVYDRGDVSIEVGRDGNDFLQNMVSILAEWRGACVVKTNDRTAFVAGTISVDAAVLETP